MKDKEGLCIVALYERWKELIQIHGQMVRNDDEWWHLVDLMTKQEFVQLTEFANEGTNFRANERLWARSHSMRNPFKVRHKKDMWKTSQNNRNLWITLMNGMEVIDKKLKRKDVA